MSLSHYLAQIRQHYLHTCPAPSAATSSYRLTQYSFAMRQRRNQGGAASLRNRAFVQRRIWYGLMGRTSLLYAARLHGSFAYLFQSESPTPELVPAAITDFARRYLPDVGLKPGCID